MRLTCGRHGDYFVHGRDWSECPACAAGFESRACEYDDMAAENWRRGDVFTALADERHAAALRRQAKWWREARAARRQS